LFYSIPLRYLPGLWKADMSELKYAWDAMEKYITFLWNRFMAKGPYPAARQTRRDASHATAPAQRILKKAEAKA
jgi:hypothetical protein